MAVSDYAPIFDWDLWPWMVAEQAGEFALSMYRLERGVRLFGITIVDHLTPALRKAEREIRRLLPVST